MQPQSLCMFQNPSLEGTRSAITLANNKNYNSVCLKSYLPNINKVLLTLSFQKFLQQLQSLKLCLSLLNMC